MKNIGEKIQITLTNGTTAEAVITGRNWSFSDLLSYIVRYDGMDIPVHPETLKAQILCH